MKNAILTLGTVQGKLNHIQLYEDIDNLMNRYSNANFQTLKLSELAHDIITVARRHKLSINPGLSMFARGVVTIESVLKICCPNVNFIDILLLTCELILNEISVGKKNLLNSNEIAI